MSTETIQPPRKSFSQKEERKNSCIHFIPYSLDQRQIFSIVSFVSNQLRSTIDVYFRMQISYLRWYRDSRFNRLVYKQRKLSIVTVSLSKMINQPYNSGTNLERRFPAELPSRYRTLRNNALGIHCGKLYHRRAQSKRIRQRAEWNRARHKLCGTSLGINPAGRTRMHWKVEIWKAVPRSLVSFEILVVCWNNVMRIL